MIVSNVEKNLQEAFKDRNENRILDIWVDLPPQIINQFINNHFEKMDKDLIKIDNAVKATDKLSASINAMEQLKTVAAQKPVATILHKLYEKSSPPAFFRDAKVPKQRKLKVFSDKISNQEVIEKRLVGQLGDRFQHAQLVEIYRNSYLISNRVKLPIFGRKAA